MLIANGRASTSSDSLIPWLTFLSTIAYVLKVVSILAKLKSNSNGGNFRLKGKDIDTWQDRKENISEAENSYIMSSHMLHQGRSL